MPKEGTFHKSYRVITVREPNGSEYKVRSTYRDELLNADISPDQHPAWTGQTSGFLRNSDQVSKFNSKYSMDFLSPAQGK